jgi:hypothetical protein
MKTRRKFAKLPSKIDEVPETVGRLGVWYGTCRGIKGGFKHEADLRGLGSPVVHRRAVTTPSVYVGSP